ncbi:hypothetical protein N7517_005474 [Penicillium concentricum]|uniref:Uncharacterized protein n=1 Tax=Penicillium concentricum TaxID=293559 RepID=A0A9W9SC72_9EURO|nr:uncharacterized protein N7517_005474 [Penicillium concentricum]KAJ5373468.1 hypothetical protein N7517_005474 [Penicillium concentricum]
MALKGTNSVLEKPGRLRLENRKALVAVYEDILELLAPVDLDIQRLERMIVDTGQFWGEGDDADEKDARLQQSFCGWKTE